MSRDRLRRTPLEVTGIQTSTKEQVIQPGQFFPLFPEGLTKRRTSSSNPFADYVAAILIVAPTGEHVRFTSIADYLGGKLYVDDNIRVAPFRPQTAYQTQIYDYDAIAGPYKYLQWTRQFDPLSTDPLRFYMAHSGEKDERVSEETYQALTNLQLQIIANGTLYQSNAELGQPDENRITYSIFNYPGAKPLPYVPDGGFELYLPDDIVRLRTLQARFILPPQRA